MSNRAFSYIVAATCLFFSVAWGLLLGNVHVFIVGLTSFFGGAYLTLAMHNISTAPANAPEQSA